MTESAESPVSAGRRFVRWFLPIASLLLSLGLAYGAYVLADYSWNQVVDYESPYTYLTGWEFSGVRPSLKEPIPDAEARRVVLVVIDGLRDDVSRTMQTVSGLRARGAELRLTVPEPSLSYPTWATILTGAPPQISGVTTNWFEGPVKVESLLDVAAGSGRSVVVSGPSDLDTMFKASEVASATAFTDWVEGDYVSDDIVDDALTLDVQVGGADFVFVLLPDVDEAGHAYGGASTEYAAAAAKVDADLGRLVEGLDDGSTTFMVMPDHGHIDTGGHGGWEDPVIHTWAALAGPGVAATTATAELRDIAPTIAVIAGLQAPMQGIGTAIDPVLADPNGSARDAEFVRAAGMTLSYIEEVLGKGATSDLETISSPSALAPMQESANAERLAEERSDRIVWLIGIALATVAIVVAVGLASWRMLVAAVSGTIVYAAVYNALFFFVHDLRWSLSAFNEEDLIQAFFNQRMLEAALAGLAGCLVAALVYFVLRRTSREPSAGWVAEWLAVGGTTILLAQAALAVQVGVFLWRWGASVVWILPDMREAFKYDLDLIQITALGAAAVLGPLLTYLLGFVFNRRRVAQA